MWHTLNNNISNYKFYTKAKNKNKIQGKFLSLKFFSQNIPENLLQTH